MLAWLWDPGTQHLVSSLQSSSNIDGSIGGLIQAGCDGYAPRITHELSRPRNRQKGAECFKSALATQDSIWTRAPRTRQLHNHDPILKA